MFNLSFCNDNELTTQQKILLCLITIKGKKDVLDNESRKSNRNINLINEYSRCINAAKQDLHHLGYNI